MLLLNSIYASGFNSTPTNYHNRLTHERVKSLTSYGSTLTTFKADPLTPKPSMHYFITGNSAMKHAHHHLKTHPAEVITGSGKRPTSGRSCQEEWYSRKDWLCDSVSTNSLYCWTCLLFKPGKSQS